MNAMEGMRQGDFSAAQPLRDLYRSHPAETERFVNGLPDERARYMFKMFLQGGMGGGRRR
jgi:hypothetical protein